LLDSVLWAVSEFFVRVDWAVAGVNKKQQQRTANEMESNFM